MSARANNSHNPIAEHTGDTFAPSRIGRTLGRDRDESCRWLAQAWELQPNLLVTDFSFGGHPAGADLIHAVKNDLRTSHIQSWS